ncbi:MAG: cytochrome C [Candidatus Aminicenantes bacterium]|nr:cytochrome C [Candidatus Aminicenantes bacterium]
MKKLIIFACALALTFNAFALITGSAHDLSGEAWALGRICVVCHVPHGADTTVANAPLWSHDLTTTTFTAYGTGFDMELNVGQPSGVSLLCLSCHDDTVALDAFVGGAGTSGTLSVEFVGTTAALGTNMQANHPVSFVYDTSAAADTEINAADATINGMLAGGAGGTLECSSCHDVHNTTVAAAPLLRVAIANSALCLVCHDK